MRLRQLQIPQPMARPTDRPTNRTFVYIRAFTPAEFLLTFVQCEIKHRQWLWSLQLSLADVCATEHLKNGYQWKEGQALIGTNVDTIYARPFHSP